MDGNKGRRPSKPVNLKRCRPEMRLVAAIVKIKEHLSSTIFDLEGNKKMPFLLASPDDFFHNRANFPGLRGGVWDLDRNPKKQQQ